MLSWLKEQTVMLDCEQTDLESESQRRNAHWFYEREGMSLTGFHYVESVALIKALQQDTQHTTHTSVGTLVIT